MDISMFMTPSVSFSSWNNFALRISILHISFLPPTSIGVPPELTTKPISEPLIIPCVNLPPSWIVSFSGIQVAETIRTRFCSSTLGTFTSMMQSQYCVLIEVVRFDSFEQILNEVEVAAAGTALLDLDRIQLGLVESAHVGLWKHNEENVMRVNGSSIFGFSLQQVNLLISLANPTYSRNLETSPILPLPLCGFDLLLWPGNPQIVPFESKPAILADWNYCCRIINEPRVEINHENGSMISNIDHVQISDVLISLSLLDVITNEDNEKLGSILQLHIQITYNDRIVSQCLKGSQELPAYDRLTYTLVFHECSNTQSALWRRDFFVDIQELVRTIPIQDFDRVSIQFTIFAFVSIEDALIRQEEKARKGKKVKHSIVEQTSRLVGTCLASLQPVLLLFDSKESSQFKSLISCTAENSSFVNHSTLSSKPSFLSGQASRDNKRIPQKDNCIPEPVNPLPLYSTTPQALQVLNGLQDYREILSSSHLRRIFSYNAMPLQKTQSKNKLLSEPVTNDSTVEPRKRKKVVNSHGFVSFDFEMICTSTKDRLSKRSNSIKQTQSYSIHRNSMSHVPISAIDEIKNATSALLGHILAQSTCVTGSTQYSEELAQSRLFGLEREFNAWTTKLQSITLLVFGTDMNRLCALFTDCLMIISLLDIKETVCQASFNLSVHLIRVVIECNKETGINQLIKHIVSSLDNHNETNLKKLPLKWLRCVHTMLMNCLLALSKDSSVNLSFFPFDDSIFFFKNLASICSIGVVLHMMCSAITIIEIGTTIDQTQYHSVRVMKNQDICWSKIKLAIVKSWEKMCESKIDSKTISDAIFLLDNGEMNQFFDLIYDQRLQLRQMIDLLLENLQSVDDRTQFNNLNSVSYTATSIFEVAKLGSVFANGLTKILTLFFRSVQEYGLDENLELVPLIENTAILLQWTAHICDSDTARIIGGTIATVIRLHLLAHPFSRLKLLLVLIIHSLLPREISMVLTESTLPILISIIHTIWCDPALIQNSNWDERTKDLAVVCVRAALRECDHQSISATLDASHIVDIIYKVLRACSNIQGEPKTSTHMSIDMEFASDIVSISPINCFCLARQKLSSKTHLSESKMRIHPNNWDFLIPSSILHFWEMWTQWSLYKFMNSDNSSHLRQFKKGRVTQGAKRWLEFLTSTLKSRNQLLENSDSLDVSFLDDFLEEEGSLFCAGFSRPFSSRSDPSYYIGENPFRIKIWANQVRERGDLAQILYWSPLHLLSRLLFLLSCHQLEDCTHDILERLVAAKSAILYATIYAVNLLNGLLGIKLLLEDCAEDLLDSAEISFVDCTRDYTELMDINHAMPNDKYKTSVNLALQIHLSLNNGGALVWLSGGLMAGILSTNAHLCHQSSIAMANVIVCTILGCRQTCETPSGVRGITKDKMILWMQGCMHVICRFGYTCSSQSSHLQKVIKKLKLVDRLIINTFHQVPATLSLIRSSIWVVRRAINACTDSIALFPYVDSCYQLADAISKQSIYENLFKFGPTNMIDIAKMEVELWKADTMCYTLTKCGFHAHTYIVRFLEKLWVFHNHWNVLREAGMAAWYCVAIQQRLALYMQFREDLSGIDDGQLTESTIPQVRLNTSLLEYALHSFSVIEEWGLCLRLWEWIESPSVDLDNQVATKSNLGKKSRRAPEVCCFSYPQVPPALSHSSVSRLLKKRGNKSNEVYFFVVFDGDIMETELYGFALIYRIYIPSQNDCTPEQVLEARLKSQWGASVQVISLSEIEKNECLPKHGSSHCPYVEAILSLPLSLDDHPPFPSEYGEAVHINFFSNPSQTVQAKRLSALFARVEPNPINPRYKQFNCDYWFDFTQEEQSDSKSISSPWSSESPSAFIFDTTWHAFSIMQFQHDSIDLIPITLTNQSLILRVSHEFTPWMDRQLIQFAHIIPSQRNPPKK